MFYGQQSLTKTPSAKKTQPIVDDWKVFPQKRGSVAVKLRKLWSYNSPGENNLRLSEESIRNRMKTEILFMISLGSLLVIRKETYQQTELFQTRTEPLRNKQIPAQ